MPDIMISAWNMKHRAHFWIYIYNDGYDDDDDDDENGVKSSSLCVTDTMHVHLHSSNHRSLYDLMESMR